MGGFSRGPGCHTVGHSISTICAHPSPSLPSNMWAGVSGVSGHWGDAVRHLTAPNTVRLFYPSKVGRQFGSDMVEDGGFWLVAFYRAWHNMKSLEEQGLDPLRVVIDRCHAKKMDFIASYRVRHGALSSLSALWPNNVGVLPHLAIHRELVCVCLDSCHQVTSYLGLEELVEFERSPTDGALNQPLEPGALALPEVRDHQVTIATQYLWHHLCPPEVLGLVGFKRASRSFG